MALFPSYYDIIHTRHATCQKFYGELFSLQMFDAYTRLTGLCLLNKISVSSHFTKALKSLQAAHKNIYIYIYHNHEYILSLVHFFLQLWRFLFVCYLFFDKTNKAFFICQAKIPSVKNYQAFPRLIVLHISPN